MARATLLTMGDQESDPAASDEDAVRARVIEAAARLFSIYGPRAVTVKWVAMEAAVASEWLEARWGSMDALLGDVLDHEARAVSAASPTIPVIHGDAFSSAADGCLDRYDRIVVRAILDGVDPAAMQSSFPLIERLIADLGDQGFGESAARARAFQLTVLELGLRLLGPTVATACGLGERPAADIDALVRELQLTLATLSSGS